MKKTEKTLEQDLWRLKTVLSMQEAQMELFQSDIRALSMKTKVIPPVCKQEEKCVASEVSSYDSEGN